MSVQMKRIVILVVATVGAGAISTFIIFANIPLGPITLGFGTTLEKFAYSNVLIMFLSFFCIIGIWLDYFMKAEILKQ